MDNGGFAIHGNASFSGNKAEDIGGVISLYFTSSNFSGSISLSTNLATYGGAIAYRNGTLIVRGNSLFERNTAKDQGGALHLAYVHFEFCGSIYFGNNTAYDRGGALYTHASIALFHDKCFIYGTAAEQPSFIMLQYTEVLSSAGIQLP